MTTAETIHDATMAQRVVLLALLAATRERSTPVNAAQLRTVCNNRLCRPVGPVAGELSEADVTRALYKLESAGLVENVADRDQSPAGKGRPAYELVAEARTVRSALADHDELRPLFDSVD